MQTVVKNISSTDTRTTAIRPRKVLMAAGGTGGHVYPAIAIADAIKALHPDTSFLFVGTKNRMEWETVPAYGYKIRQIWISGFHRRLTLRNLLFPVKLAVSLIQSVQIMRSFKPDAVVACGGFVCGPVGWIAAKMGVSVFLQEQNSFPGVTTRLLAKEASIIFTAFKEATRYLPTEKVELTGNPVRSAIEPSDKLTSCRSFNLSDEKPVLLILGGSGGAKAINDIMLRRADSLLSADIQIIWQCGEKYYERLQQELDEAAYPGLRLLAYVHNMPAAYGAADLVVTRAGAGTCSELMNIGKAAILVPSPNVAGDHQTKNAESLSAVGAARLMSEGKLETDFLNEVVTLIRDESQLKQMSQQMLAMAKPDAASTIATRISNYISQAEL